MATYPGNPALAAEVKEKILTTFRHTANLFQQGKKDDTVVGCEFILKMDPRFQPAIDLLKAAKGGTPIDLSAWTGGGGDPLGEARAALDARDFARAAALADQVLAGKPNDAVAAEIASSARELLEAQPFVTQFLQKAKSLIDNGQNVEAGKELDKAAAIDGTHPDLKRLRARVAEAMAPSSGFEFEGDEAPIGLGGEVVETPAAEGQDFGFQFAPDDAADMPTIGLASPAAEPSEPAPAAGEAEFAFDSEPTAEADFAPEAAPPSFSFESSEPAAEGFSFDAPAPLPPPPPPKAAPAPPPPPPPKAAPAPPPAAPAAPAAFDFGAPPSFGDEPQDPKVGQLLDEGDRAFAGGDLQGAIDIWSRIFLIDVTNQDASERINKAKAAKGERDRKVDAVIAKGVEAMKAGNSTDARARFDEALLLDPTSASAKSYIAQLESGGGPKAGDDRLLGPSTATVADGGKDILSDDILGDYAPPPPAEEGMYEAGGEEAADDELPAPARARAAKKSPVMLIAIIVGVLALVGGAVWYFVLRDKGGETTPVAPTITGAARITNAKVHMAGQEYDLAIKELEKVAADDPAYSQAIRLIDECKQKKAQASPANPSAPTGDAAVDAQFAEAKSKGLEAMSAGEYLAAFPVLSEAAKMKPDDLEVKQALAAANEKVTKLSPPLDQFNEGSYEAAIGLLWRLREEDKTNADVERLLVNSYFNLGVVELQSGTAKKAAEQFKEVLGLRPDDIEAARHLKLSQDYENKKKDLQFRIYTHYLQLRSS